MVEKKFSVACKEFFGFQPGQTLSEFMVELRALTEEDRAYFIREFEKAGIKIV